jgi:phosphohistidine phosphatase
MTMKTLMLLRHAKSSWKDADVPDHDRPLNKRGKKTAPQMGRLLSTESLVPDLILSSTAVRARETAKAVAKAASYKGPTELLESLYLATAGKLLSEAQSHTPDSVGRLLLVGHNPGMEDLVEILSGKREAFPTAALAVFEVGIDQWGALELGVETKLVKVYRPKEIE